MPARFTLDAPVQHEVRIRKSRFLAQAAPASDEKAALAFLEDISASDANHNCWAFRTGERYRFSDDGEPGGSAGKPILMAIDGQAMDHVMVVVTRWFGGIKLGVGGLMRAYGGTAANCLRAGRKRPIIAMARVRFALGYAELERLRPRLTQWWADILDEQHGACEVNVTTRLPQMRLEELQGLLADLSRGQSQLTELDDSRE